ncbi:hypothetical protein EYF80_034220 [Liparis tanakae]|uniref:Uncharacterized protein n=1 Tax=Liparis tanakae TaxID=230148 RepID=A0A4Z2GS69_9TELE|nr:hypothetical protein EYF80_034220 [Liparis tanakae]
MRTPIETQEGLIVQHATAMLSFAAAFSRDKLIFIKARGARAEKDFAFKGGDEGSVGIRPSALEPQRMYSSTDREDVPHSSSISINKSIEALARPDIS